MITNPIEQFRNVILSAGLAAPDNLEAGKFYRFPGEGKNKPNTAGWCKLFPDGLGGVFGDHSSGVSTNWQAEHTKQLDHIGREAFKHQIAEAKKQAESDQRARHTDAARKANATWEAAKPALKDHPYLIHKGIKPSGARLHNNTLVIPLTHNGKIHSLQLIQQDGDKRFLTGGQIKGCYFSIGNPAGAEALCIAEGFATGATIHEITGHPVAVAFSAGNLGLVAQAMRAKFPDLALVLCADDDVGTESNPGLTAATEAARSVGGLLAIPNFGISRHIGTSDFNDMAKLCGKEAVSNTIANAKAPSRLIHQTKAENFIDCDFEAWPDPKPMTAKINHEPYPLKALPDTVRAAVEEVMGFVKAPVPLIASSALAAISLAIQAHVDAKRAEKLDGPVGLFLLTIADSGDRKSTCDGFFTQSIREYEKAKTEEAQPILKNYRAAMEAWEAKHSGLKELIRSLTKSGKPTYSAESSLRDIEYDKPIEPRVPRLIFSDVTPEALAFGLANKWPSGGIVSDEAGIVFGSHGMSGDSAMRNLATLNQLWDGNSLTIDRKTSESFTVRGARLTVALLVQEPTLRAFLEKSGTLARGTGFLARFLIAWPESTQGYRPFTEAPENWHAHDKFNRRISEILNQPVPIDDGGALTPQILPFSPEAKTAWIKYHDIIEGKLANGGELYEVRDVASKSADNAARLAALFQIFEYGGSVIGAEAFERASCITAWHLSEAQRFFGEFALPEELANGVKLNDWLIEFCRREQTLIVSTREAQRLGPVRCKVKLATAIQELEELGRVRITHDGRRKTIKLNPALIDVAI